MKYGYNDQNWRNIPGQSSIGKEIVQFNINVFQPFMKRKTLYEADVEMFNAFNEMVEMMNEHAKEMKKV